MSDLQINKYKKARSKTQEFKNFNRSEIKDILGTELTHTQANPSSPDATDFWRDCVAGYLKKRTDKIISETTNWNKRNYFWYSAGGKHNYRIKDRIFLFDTNDNKLRLVEVADIARTKVTTPDGRNFIAYKRVRGYEKKLTKNLWLLLEKEGIKSNAMNKRVSITIEAAKKLSSLIKTKRA